MKSMLKIDARVLRRRGYSFRQLSERLDISKSTASVWTRDVEMSPLGVERLSKYRKERNEFGHEILHQKKLERLKLADSVADDLFRQTNFQNATTIIALSMIYWCEGIKRDTNVRFTNSDPRLARVFINMLEKTFVINRSKIRVTVHLHDYHNKKEVMEFWSSTLGIPLIQFTKPYRKKSNHIYTHEGYKGCVRISYGDSHVARVLHSFAKKYINLYI